MFLYSIESFIFPINHVDSILLRIVNVAEHCSAYYTEQCTVCYIPSLYKSTLVCDKCYVTCDRQFVVLCIPVKTSIQKGTAYPLQI